MTRKMIIDTDTASDDAVAIMMALQTPDIEVEAITIVAGNMPVEQGSINARYTVELCGKHVPVYHGADKPLMREIYRAYFFHGPDGMGGMNYQAQTPPAEGHAVDVLIETIKANPGIILVTLGPLTNVALAVQPGAGDRGERQPLRGDGRRGQRGRQHHARRRIQHLVRS